MTDFPDYLDIDYTDGQSQTAADYPSLAAKVEKAAEVTLAALQQYRKPAVMWTGGKDSTVVLYVVREVAREHGFEVPPVVFLDHFEHFTEVEEFVRHWTDEWDLDLVWAANEDFQKLGVTPGESVAVTDLNETNQRELARLGYDDAAFVLDADSFEGNHLLKTVVLNQVITDHGFDAVFSGVRWDEQESRATETFFSPRHESEKYPPHDRVHSILQFDERDVWDTFWQFIVPDTVEGYPAGHVPESTEDLPDGMTARDLPVSPKYFEGFRSLGTESGSSTSDDRPAWLQDLDGTTEREGRAQDKENLMEQLRDLGYM